MRSVTEQGALDEFLSTAELAGTDFTAEKMNNVKIIHKDQKNPYLLSAADERSIMRKHRENRDRLSVPRRPKWDEKTTPQELDTHEKEALLQWRRGLAELQENNDLLMTPFERNLEVWRQLWRVIERSDLVVQIVDARNPLLFRSEDLEVYVKEVDPKKNNLLLVNKADMMTLDQRRAWADYFTEAGINYKFFSAELAKELNEARAHEEDSEEDSEGGSEEEEEDEDESPSEDDVEENSDSEDDDLVKKAKKINIQDKKQESANDEGAPLSEEEERIRILTTEDLEALFLENSPDVDTGPNGVRRKTQIGLVGYPNVGKSSTINALIGAKKVSVSATPGKTKHFQTVHLSEEVVLCDCPGLVFPNFAFTKAELVCCGVLPIDQLREYTGPAGLVAQRIPQPFLEAIYGMKMEIRPQEEGGTGIPTSEEMLRAYAIARGFSTQGLGQPDESRAARYILKDYVKGKLLFVHPPPVDQPINPKQFNRELYDVTHLPERRRAQFALRAGFSSSAADAHDDTANVDDDDLDILALSGAPVTGQKTARMDKKFFGPGQGNAVTSMPFHHKYSEQGKELSGRKLKTITALERDVDPSEIRTSSKKHFKANKKRAKKVKTEYD
ncbi:P-loop containing nucleoside triphosphate hydrolase protein [Dothidotthia symphoricarpi CBS 119687]|uniref:P-loop containing nucleoside triphosphate hydrolase protein n=1 Tax=Dothidotthia symphoricarpi CBS 119687 TaxID=1392245 RepID=A0A6A6ACE7_9PLEO|nr:P-loop containing nucleoside triphosphate hydrolase protein [Dothidotthia symphoricarpi CBS 119687]KAF2128391.1 P-loop containing nucleoside triphosphate hydrolase protein [Dothidotthia symphoricarpi CBS 119687]